MSDLAAYPPQPVYKDRGAGLTVVGILEICLALLVWGLIVVLWLGAFGFLVWSRRFFVGASEGSGGSRFSSQV